MTSLPLRRSTVAVLGGVALAASAAGAPPPASAAGRPAAGVPFSVTPVGRPSLRFDARPGATVTGRVRVENLGPRPRTVRLRPSDLVTADTGGPWFPAKAAARVGAWLELDRPLVRLPGRGGRTVTFRAKVPPGAPGGQHFAGIVAVDTREAAAARAPTEASEGVRVRHLTRLALPVRLTAPGALTTHVAVTDLDFGVDATGPSLRVGLRNDSNRIVRTTAIDLQVTKVGRRLLVIDEDVQDFLPASAISYPVAWAGRLEPGTYRVTGVVRPEGGDAVRVDQDVTFGAKLAGQLERKTGDPAPAGGGQPVWIWIALGGLLLASAGITLAYVRLRRTVVATSA